MEKEKMIAINKWFYFSMNFPYNFIKLCWADTPDFAEFLDKKFDGLFDTYGAEGVINALYSSLDRRNKKKLLSWVLENYDGEQEMF